VTSEKMKQTRHGLPHTIVESDYLSLEEDPTLSIFFKLNCRYQLLFFRFSVGVFEQEEDPSFFSWHFVRIQRQLFVDDFSPPLITSYLVQHLLPRGMTPGVSRRNRLDIW
jgi:hypothetical protein